MHINFHDFGQLLSSHHGGLYATVPVSLFVCLSPESRGPSGRLGLKAAVTYVLFVKNSPQWETRREIYACGGGLLVESINASHSFNRFVDFMKLQGPAGTAEKWHF